MLTSYHDAQRWTHRHSRTSGGESRLDDIERRRSLRHPRVLLCTGHALHAIVGSSTEGHVASRTAHVCRLDGPPHPTGHCVLERRERAVDAETGSAGCRTRWCLFEGEKDVLNGRWYGCIAWITL